MTGLSKTGQSADDVIDALVAKRDRDVRWGRRPGLRHGLRRWPRSARGRRNEQPSLYLHENALNTKAFPSLRDIQSEVVGWTGSLLNGPDTVSGFLTSGGTESILVAVKAARERGRAERGLTEPNIVLSAAAHAALPQGRLPIRTRGAQGSPFSMTGPPDVSAMADLVDENTALVVGSAPQYPQGVIDDIAGIACVGDRGRGQLPCRCMYGRFRLAVCRDARAVIFPSGTSGSKVSLQFLPIFTNSVMPRRVCPVIPAPHQRTAGVTRRSSSTTGSGVSTHRPTCKAYDQVY